MQSSKHRILTTHVGSLPRVSTLRDLLIQRERNPGMPVDGLEDAIERGVHTVVGNELVDPLAEHACKHDFGRGHRVSTRGTSIEKHGPQHRLDGVGDGAVALTSTALLVASADEQPLAETQGEARLA